MKPNKDICEDCQHKLVINDKESIFRYGSIFACWKQVQKEVDSGSKPETLFDVPDEVPDTCRYKLEQTVLR